MFRRRIKNVVRSYSPTEILVREATSNDPWGPSNTLLSRIAEMSNDEGKMMQIMPIIWKRLKDTGKNWRHVHKSLLLMEFLILRGNPSITDHCRQHIHFIKSLESFSYIEKNDDIGIRIRRRVRIILQLLRDEEHLRNERRIALNTDMKFSRDMVAQGSNVPVKYGNGVGTMSQGPSMGSFGGSSDKMSSRVPVTSGTNRDMELPIPANSIEEDIQLEIALAESKMEAENQKVSREIDDLRDEYTIAMAVQKNNLHNKGANKQMAPKVPSSTKSNEPWTSFPTANEKKSSTNNVFKSESLAIEEVGFEDNDIWNPKQCKSEVKESDNVHNHQNIFTTNDPWCPTINSCKPNVDLDPWSPVSNGDSISRDFKNSLISDNVSTTTIGANQHNYVAAKFLGSNSHLVDFDNLLPSNDKKNLVPQNQFNPFTVNSHSEQFSSTNPFINPNLPSATEYSKQDIQREFMGLSDDKILTTYSSQRQPHRTQTLRPNDVNQVEDMSLSSATLQSNIDNNLVSFHQSLLRRHRLPSDTSQSPSPSYNPFLN